MQIFQMLTNFILQNQKITLINISTDIIRTILKYWKAVKPIIATQVFQNSKFWLESLHFIIGNMTPSTVSLEVTGSRSTKCPIPNNTVCQSVFQGKCSAIKKWPVQQATPMIAHVLSLRLHSAVLPGVSHLRLTWSRRVLQMRRSRWCRAVMLVTFTASSVLG